MPYLAKYNIAVLYSDGSIKACILLIKKDPVLRETDLY